MRWTMPTFSEVLVPLKGPVSSSMSEKHQNTEYFYSVLELQQDTGTVVIVLTPHLSLRHPIPLVSPLCPTQN
jgi:hypothetical protein